jgi:hypothetical protein
VAFAVLAAGWVLQARERLQDLGSVPQALVGLLLVVVTASVLVQLERLVYSVLVWLKAQG